jgi:hypothetical protein
MISAKQACSAKRATIFASRYGYETANRRAEPRFPRSLIPRWCGSKNFDLPPASKTEPPLVIKGILLTIDTQLGIRAESGQVRA